MRGFCWKRKACAPLELDPVHANVGFTAAAVLFDVDGDFGQYTTKTDPNEPESVKGNASIDVASINTQNTTRDNHLNMAPRGPIDSD